MLECSTRTLSVGLRDIPVKNTDRFDMIWISYPGNPDLFMDAAATACEGRRLSKTRLDFARSKDGPQWLFFLFFLSASFLTY
jgi:hypothetical protein